MKEQKMNKIRIIAATVMCMLAVGCDKSVEEADSKKNQSKIISNELIASCPNQNLAMRVTDSASPVLDVTENKGKTAIVSVYKQNGSLIYDSLMLVIPYFDTTASDVHFAWNGKDSLGNALPDGNYFFYYSVLDSLNSVRLKDSTCISLVNYSAE